MNVIKLFPILSVVREALLHLLEYIDMFIEGTDKDIHYLVVQVGKCALKQSFFLLTRKIHNLYCRKVGLAF